ncbi:MAG: DNA-3-methyladenine glycosylase [Euzebyales bacterium]|nr:DNA-3-methyladenine glycosylase [Euzebyales bacterium]
MSGRPTRRRLGRAFFARPAPVVARELVGALLVRDDESLVARIVETEAYMQHDPACHAYRQLTPRNAPLYGPAGHAYVYSSYGLHWCLNTATGADGSAEGCLLRAAEPLDGLEVMRARRGERVRARDLLRGPARLAQAFGLDGTWSGRDLCAGGPLHLASDGTSLPVGAGPRVGVTQAADTPWRFAASGSPWVSAYKRSPRAPRAAQSAAG